MLEAEAVAGVVAVSSALVDVASTAVAESDAVAVAVDVGILTPVSLGEAVSARLVLLVVGTLPLPLLLPWPFP